MFTETWYWDRTDADRAWTKRWDKARCAPARFRA